MTDGSAYAVEGKDIVALCFRGTDSIKNWKTNFQASLIHPENTDAKLRVHEGFYHAFIALCEGNNRIEDKMKEIKMRNPNTPIYFTGHSLGGALAQIAAAVLGDDQTAACYTFGSPRVGNMYLDQWVKTPSYRVMNYADIVPQSPLPILYRHAGDARYMPDKAGGSPYRFQPNILERTWQNIRGLFQYWRTFSILGIEDHSMKGYCKKLDQVALDRSRTQTGLRPGHGIR
jgi:triacylglycerol lipase